MKRWMGYIFLSVLVAACQDATQPVPVNSNFSQASARSIPGQFIVVFNRDVNDAPGLARRLTASHGGSLLHVYQFAIKGFAARLPDGAADALSHNPAVAYVEQDAEAQLHGTQFNPPSWGLDRIDSRTGLDDSYTFGTTGSGVNIYILDTGIRDSHIDFGGRASFVPNGRDGDFVLDGYGDANGAEDCHGHAEGSLGVL